MVDLTSRVCAPFFSVEHEVFEVHRWFVVFLFFLGGGIDLVLFVELNL